MINEKLKEWIDNASYEELLRRWRFAPMDDPMFRMDTGEYYRVIMNKRGSELDACERVAISKRVGWDR